jgi:hypothetical protein
MRSNYRLSRARMVTEGAYGQLKGRWRILLRKCESTNEEVRRCALACVVLHNVCIERGDTISQKLDLTTDPLTQQRRLPITHPAVSSSSSNSEHLLQMGEVQSIHWYVVKIEQEQQCALSSVHLPAILKILRGT